MNVSEFQAQVSSAAASLSASDLFYVHFDERKCSVVLGFAAQEGGDVTEFFLHFTDIRNVTVRGWSAPGAKDVQLEDGPHGITARVESDGSALQFQAMDMSLERVRTFRASPTP